MTRSRLREASAVAARLLASGAATLALVGLGGFLLLEIAPGDYLDEMRLDPRIPPETVASLRQRHGLDRPVFERYVRWLASAAGGDWGVSFAYGLPVADLLWPRTLRTLALCGTSLALAWTLAVPLGVWWAARGSGPAAFVLGVASVALLALPEVLLALLVLAVAGDFGWAPGASPAAPGAGWGASLREWSAAAVAPLLVLALPSAAWLGRHVRVLAGETLRAPFVVALRGRGLSQARVLLRYVIPSLGAPLAGLFAGSLGGLLSGSLLVEVVLGWPGLGPLLLEAALARDAHVVVGGAVWSAACVVAGNGIGDLVMRALDPRLRDVSGAWRPQEGRA